MRNFSLFLILSIFAVVPALKAQLCFNDIEYKAIPSKKVRNYLNTQQNAINAQYLSELEVSCANGEDLSDFHVYEKTYKVKSNVHNVWNTYKNASPTEAWTNRKSVCAMVYEREYDEIIYPDEVARGITTGQVLFMDLKILKGFYHLATSFEITRVEDELGVIQLNYTQSGVSQGKQIIHMEENTKGETIITHTSIIKSGSNFRDRYLYPYFHNKLINVFHRKMKRLVKSGELIHEDLAN